MNKNTFVETVNNLQAIIEEVKMAKNWEEFTQGATPEERTAMEDLPRWCRLLESWYQEIPR